MVRLVRLLSHQATNTATVWFVTSWCAATALRVALAALRWDELDHDAAALPGAFAYGALVDAALAAATALLVLAFGASTHFAPRERVRRRIRRALGFALAAGTAAVALFGVAAAWWRERIWPVHAQRAWSWPARVRVTLLAVAVAVGAARAGMTLNDAAASARSLRANVRNQEPARNGPASFAAAVRDNELSFRRFYATLDDGRVRQLAGDWPRPRSVAMPVPANGRPMNAQRPHHVVIVQVESLSAAFLGVFGNPKGLTPKLDHLAREGVLFRQLYATGTRTVRGLEALSAALPPLPGQARVRRPGNVNLVTLGAVLREQGFESSFLYGGYGYFDNMNAYFGANGYRVRDRHDIPSGRIGFANIRGIADEYLFDDALARMDRATSAGGRQWLYLTTTSNHRPHTWPQGRIDVASGSGREGAVRYTDWAIGRFIEQARTHPWFDETLFVIVADHCASVAGKTRLPPSHFGPTVQERAWIANYQEIGRLTRGEHGSLDLVVLAPMRRVAQYRVDPDGVARRVPVDAVRAAGAIADYPLADDLIQSGRYRAVPAGALRVARGVGADGDGGQPGQWIH